MFFSSTLKFYNKNLLLFFLFLLTFLPPMSSFCFNLQVLLCIPPFADESKYLTSSAGKDLRKKLTPEHLELLKAQLTQANILVPLCVWSQFEVALSFFSLTFCLKLFKIKTLLLLIYTYFKKNKVLSPLFCSSFKLLLSCMLLCV